MLQTSAVHRKLETKFKIGGVEAADLIGVLLVSAVMNLIFGQFAIAPLLVFGVPCLLFVILYFGKRGKPDGYLLHVIRYYLSSGALLAGEKPEGSR